MRRKCRNFGWITTGGTLTLDEVVRILSREKACDERVTARFIRDAIDRQEEIVETRALVDDLKRAGYKLYVLSNMSREFIDFLRRMPVYRCFDGEVISCEEQVVKPGRRSTVVCSIVIRSIRPKPFYRRPSGESRSCPDIRYFDFSVPSPRSALELR